MNRRRDASDPVHLDLRIPPRPLFARGRSYEVLDLSARPLGRRHTLQEVLDLIAEWPRRTVFLVRLWTQQAGAMQVEKQWLISRGLDGVFRCSEVRRHWTIRPGPG